MTTIHKTVRCWPCARIPESLALTVTLLCRTFANYCFYDSLVGVALDVVTITDGGNDQDGCAEFARPAHAGMFSGALGSVHPRTGQANVGGNCCSNTTWAPLGA